MDQRKSIIILGEAGVGKTAIITNVLSERGTRNILYSKGSATLKESLINLTLFSVGRKIRRLNTLALKKICYGILDKKPEYLIFDHVAWVEPRYYGFLTYLMEKELPLVILTQRPDKKNIGHLWMALYNFERVEITNLDRPKTDELVSHYIQSFGLKLTQDDDFQREVFNISKGNPKIIRQLCSLAQDEKYRAKGYIDVRLMDLDRRIHATMV